MINTLKRHSWFFAAAGISSWIAAGVPLFVRIFDQAEQPSYATPGWLEVIALAAFGLALAAAILDNQGSTFKRWLLLGVQSAAIMIMGLHSAGTMIFPLLVLVAWQATLMMSFHGALAWTVLQTLVLWAVLLPTWNSLACRVTLGIFLAFQFFGVFAARLTRDEASHARELTRINAELRATRHLLSDAVRAEERAHISRELHDAWGHDLTALTLHLEYAGHLSEGEVREKIEVAKTLARSLLAKSRDVVSALRIEPGCDIAHMLQELLTDMPPLAVHLNVPAEVQAACSAHAQAILRCVQEAITNVLKHAGAKNIWIDISQLDGKLRIAVRDDGRGAPDSTPGNGLNGMRNRFEELGGGFQIIDERGAGFALEAWLPQLASAS